MMDYNQFRPFISGAIAGCTATCCIQPIDTIKVRVQLEGENINSNIKRKNAFQIGRTLIRNEGYPSLYKGLSAALLRQVTYGATRLGLYKVLSNRFVSDSNQYTFVKRLGCGLISGGLGAFIGTPADVVLVRMQTDNLLPINQRRNYRNVFDAFGKIVKNEGIYSLWSGSKPTILRAMSINVGMLSLGYQSKEIYKNWYGEGIKTNLLTSASAGLFASILSLPFDFIKTRIQRQTRLSDGSYPYRGVVDCVQKVCKNEGIFAFYKGFPTFYCRIAPHAMITIFLLDYLEKII
jgi:solute carrier family 25 oxoglutarate transporter 11